MGGNAASGAQALHEAVTIADDNPELLEQPQLLPWIALGPLFLRESEAGRHRLDAALRSARERGAIGTLPFVLGPDRTRPGDHRPLAAGRGHLP